MMKKKVILEITKDIDRPVIWIQLIDNYKYQGELIALEEGSLTIDDRYDGQIVIDLATITKVKLVGICG